MAKVLRCKDLAYACEFVARGETVEQILQQAATHAREVHKVELPPEFVERIKRTIHDE